MQKEVITDDGSESENDIMKKYKRLILSLVAVISLVAFLFYKHEYDRLRYTLEYLDTFGEAPSETEIRQSCAYNTIHKLSTPPASWTLVDSDLWAYSAFYEDGGIMGEPHLKIIAAVKDSSKSPANLEALFWLETVPMPLPGVCSIENNRERQHSDHKLDTDVWSILYIHCISKDKDIHMTNAPYKVQLRVGESNPSSTLYVHVSEGMKSVVNRTALCVTPYARPMSSLFQVEFLSYYTQLGVNKFTLYGSTLTPLTRLLLDKYADDMGVSYEEKLFATSSVLSLETHVARQVIEEDCMYRHRDTHENVLVVSPDEFLILHHSHSIQEVLASLLLIGGKGNNGFSEISEIHLSSQLVCIDWEHLTGGDKLLLSQLTHTMGPAEEVGTALLRPHVLTSVPVTSLGGEPVGVQHLPTSIAVLRQFVTCRGTESHHDSSHLPSNDISVKRIKESILYRKWKVYQ